MTRWSKKHSRGLVTIFRLCLLSHLVPRSQMVSSAVTPALTNSSTFKEVFQQLKGRPRETANEWIKNHVDKMAGDEWQKYREAREAEIFHVHHVRQVMLAGNMTSVSPRGHDFSKDEWYWFVTIGKFTMEQKELLREDFKQVTEEHYKVEPHHEEYEELNGVECPPESIPEMAVDRLSRNLQFNGGVYNMAQMTKYKPQFTLGNIQGKLEHYESSLSKFEKLTKTVWDELRRESQEPGM